MVSLHAIEANEVNVKSRSLSLASNSHVDRSVPWGLNTSSHDRNDLSAKVCSHILSVNGESISPILDHDFTTARAKIPSSVKSVHIPQIGCPELMQPGC